MTDPFRVVIDWAGSRLQGVSDEKRFERGLIRRITTKQYDDFYWRLDLQHRSAMFGNCTRMRSSD